MRVTAHSAVHDAAAVCKKLCQLGLSHLQVDDGLLSAMRASAGQQPMLGEYHWCQMLLSCSELLPDPQTMAQAAAAAEHQEVRNATRKVTERHA